MQNVQRLGGHYSSMSTEQLKVEACKQEMNNELAHRMIKNGAIWRQEGGHLKGGALRAATNDQGQEGQGSSGLASALQQEGDTTGRAPGEH